MPIACRAAARYTVQSPRACHGRRPRGATVRAPYTPRPCSPLPRCVRALAAAALALACARGGPPAPSTDDAAPEQRLPREVRPLRYALQLNVMPERDGFQGTARIEVELERPARRLWLHARDLEVKSATVESGGAEAAADLTQVTPEGLARLTFGRELPGGRAVLRFTYQGRWSERVAGLRRVRSGAEAYAVTQLQPGDARRVFPCFDEPVWKVPFQVTLTVPAKAVAVSNAPALGEDRAEGRTKRVRFAETAPLTTDRVLVAVGPFDVLTGAPVAAAAGRPPLPLRLLAPRGTRESVRGGAGGHARNVVHRGALVRGGVPVPEARRRGRAGFPRGRRGERGRFRPGQRAARPQSRPLARGETAGGGEPHRARARPPVVRRPRRPGGLAGGVAGRGVRDLPGVEGARALEARGGYRRRHGPSHRGGHGPRVALRCPSGPLEHSRGSRRVGTARPPRRG